jgi:hypothetical protein
MGVRPKRLSTVSVGKQSINTVLMSDDGYEGEDGGGGGGEQSLGQRDAVDSD